MRSSVSLSLICGALIAGIPAAPAFSEASVTVPVYRVTVVGRTIQAISFRDPNGRTYVDFRGTPLLATAEGKAQFQRKQGSLRVDLKLDKLVPAARFGGGYLTYVLWAITPEGRPTNLGELALDGDHARLNTTTGLQAFGLIVTAEPYFAVTQPSDLVVAEAVVPSGTSGRLDTVEAHYELLKRDGTAFSAGRSEAGIPVDRHDRDVAQARNAIAISLASGAAEGASEPIAKAQNLLRQAEAAKSGSKSAVMFARQATQTAEDARQIAIEHQELAGLASERAASAKREASAKADTRVAEQLADEAQADTRHAERRAAAAQATTRDAETRAAEARADTRDAEARADEARDDTLEAEQRVDEAQADAQNAEEGAAMAIADASRQVDEANRAAAEAEMDKNTFRAQLLQQLSVILVTRETTRGLLVNIPDVSFDVDRSTLRIEAREKLAKLAGIILSHPGLELATEGHTDSTGSVAHNQTLSQDRAISVRDFLVSQGLTAAPIIAAGFGMNHPIASNDSAAGRQLNRRVEVIVSGAVMGVTVSALLPMPR